MCRYRPYWVSSVEQALLFDFQLEASDLVVRPSLLKIDAITLRKIPQRVAGAVNAVMVVVRSEVFVGKDGFSSALQHNVAAPVMRQSVLVIVAVLPRPILVGLCSGHECGTQEGDQSNG